MSEGRPGLETQAGENVDLVVPRANHNLCKVGVFRLAPWAHPEEVIRYIPSANPRPHFATDGFIEIVYCWAQTSYREELQNSVCIPVKTIIALVTCTSINKAKTLQKYPFKFHKQFLKVLKAWIIQPQNLKRWVKNLRFLGYTKHLFMQVALNEITTLQIIGLITLNRLLMV